MSPSQCDRAGGNQQHFLAARAQTSDIGRKREFYPDTDKRDLFRLGYMSSRSRHSRGSTVDLTIVDRASGEERDMGTPFDHFGAGSAYAAAGITPAQRANRALLRSAMQRHGFAPIAKEWWHFTLRREPFRSRFDFPVR